MTDSKDIVPPPLPVGVPHQVDITGYILPMWLEQPLLFDFPGLTAPMLFIFSTFEALAAGKRSLIDFRHDALKRIDDGDEFLASLPQDGSLVLGIDPVLTDQGTTRYKQVRLQPDAIVDTAALYDYDGRQS